VTEGPLADARSVCVTIWTDSDVSIARIRTQRFAIDEGGFTETEAVAIATAVSELARNVLVHAAHGEVALSVVVEESRRGILVVVRDEGPGITDTERALQDGYSSTGTLGLGLPSAQRLVDELHVVSVPGVGTTVTATKWKS
jgi:serine/threonine-protein kinase RsbT